MYEKCKFPKMGTKTHQLKKPRKDSKERLKKIEEDKKRRLKEWRMW